ncbi:MAG: hypothetical protein WDN30_15020 [Pararobbsia sp.]
MQLGKEVLEELLFVGQAQRMKTKGAQRTLVRCQGRIRRHVDGRETVLDQRTCCVEVAPAHECAGLVAEIHVLPIVTLNHDGKVGQDTRDHRALHSPQEIIELRDAIQAQTDHRIDVDPAVGEILPDRIVDDRARHCIEIGRKLLGDLQHRHPDRRGSVSRQTFIIAADRCRS